MRTSEHTKRRCQLGILLAFIPALAAAQTAGAPPAVAPASSSPTVESLIDPSLRSPLAAPSVQVAAEIKDDTKFATGKLGFTFKPGWTGELGFTGAFDHELAASRPSSLRRLTDDSSIWAATTWIRPRASRRIGPLVSTRVETSRDGFDYYDLALARHTDTHTSYAVTATAGLILPRAILVSASYRWSHSWQVDDGSEPCRAAAATGVTSCAADRLFRRAAPHRWQQFEAQAQARRDRIGAELLVTRDLREHAWGVEVPVYFMTRREGGFTGGLVLTYNGATDRVDVSLFVGRVFRLFK